MAEKPEKKQELSMGEIVKFLIWLFKFLIWLVLEFPVVGFPKKHRPKDKTNGVNSEENRKTVEKP